MKYRPLICLILAGTLAGSVAAQEAPRPLTAAEELELKTYSGQLADGNRDAQTKFEAATLLLTRNYPQATAALERFLKSSANQSAQIAIAKAIAVQGSDETAYVAPLVAMLTGKIEAVRAPAARALVTYKNHGVTDTLVEIALDAQRDKSVRLVAIEAISMVLDKQAVDALVRLLDDPDATVRDAAMTALASLTNMPFGKNRQEWQLWWAKNSGKKPTQWLADLADILARSKTALETDNARLRERLIRALTDLYNATPDEQRGAMLLGLLKDPLADARTVGLTLADRRLSEGKTLPPVVVAQLRSMLADNDPDIRRAAALLLADTADEQAMPMILDRLEKEQAPAVRTALVTALGRLKDPQAISVVLREINSKFEQTAAAAARSLGQIVRAKPLKTPQRTEVTAALAARYEKSDDGADGALLREALVTAMQALGDPASVGVLKKAVKDRAATVRLAAVNALAAQGAEEAETAAAIAPLAEDADRGVRRAAIAALGALDGQTYRAVVLQRTDPKIEDDAGVRDEAWSVLMTLLGKAGPPAMREVAKALVDRPDAAAQRIKILQMLVSTLTASNDPGLVDAQRDLGEALMAAQRPAEAAGPLAEVYSAMSTANSPDADAIWSLWFTALLTTDDPAAVKTLAAQKNPAVFEKASGELVAHLEQLNTTEKFAPVVIISGLALRGLGPRLTESQREALRGLESTATARQRQADRVRVDALTVALVGADEAAAKAASAEILAMGHRAILPLLEELLKVLKASQVDVKAEKALLTSLQMLAPKLTGYDASAPAAARIKLVDQWRRQMGS